MTYTSTQIREAIDAWAEAQVDKEIADRVQWNKEYNEKYATEIASPGYNRYGPRKRNTDPEQFDREDVASELAEGFYEASETELPGLGTATLVDSYGGEGQGDEYWRVYKIGDEYYKADHYYSSYDVEPWHGSCTWFHVVPKEVTVTKWV